MRFFKNLLLVLTGTVALLGLSSVTAQADDVVANMLKTGEMKVAVQTQGPPISFVDKNGKRTGLAVEIVRKLADASGVKLKLVDYDWKGLIPALLSGKADIIAGDMTPTQKRAMKLNFTIPIFYSEVRAMAQKDKPFKKWEDLNKKGITIGVTQASDYVGIVEQHMPKATLKQFAGGGPATAQAVASGRVDAAVMDRGTEMQFTKEFAGMRMLDGVIRKEPLSFAVRPENTHLLQFLNNYIRFIQTDGELKQMVDYWWNSSAWEKDHK